MRVGQALRQTSGATRHVPAVGSTLRGRTHDGALSVWHIQVTLEAGNCCRGRFQSDPRGSGQHLEDQGGVERQDQQRQAPATDLGAPAECEFAHEFL